MSTKDVGLVVCNFCDTDERTRNVMLVRDRDTAICDECIVIGVRILAESAQKDDGSGVATKLTKGLKP